MHSLRDLIVGIEDRTSSSPDTQCRAALTYASFSGAICQIRARTFTGSYGGCRTRENRRPPDVFLMRAVPAIEKARATTPRVGPAYCSPANFTVVTMSSRLIPHGTPQRRANRLPRFLALAHLRRLTPEPVVGPGLQASENLTYTAVRKRRVQRLGRGL